MGLAEIADFLDVSPPRAFKIAADYEDFPEPIAELRSGRIWLAADVRAWRRKHPVRKVGRPPKKKSSKANSR